MISSKILGHAKHVQASFRAARPFKHVYLPDFLEAEVAETLLRDFPAFDRDKALDEYGKVGGKAVNTKLAEISPFYKRFYDYLFSQDFLGAMSEISGIPDLLGDTTLYGGGTHENLSGQELDPHVDFNYVVGGSAHRRMNLLIYLNRGWRPEWGGAIELHSNPRDPDTNEITAFNVDFNKALLFETNEYSWHGFRRIELPAELATTHSRKCVSIYLYTATRPAEEIAGTHATFYVQRPLAPRFRAGYRLTDEDVHELAVGYRRRDQYIEYYQKQEEQFGRRFKELEELAAVRAGDLKLPMVGFVKALSLKSGQVWPDRWTSKNFCVELAGTRRLARIETRVGIPESAPSGPRHFVLDAGGTRKSFQTTGHGSFTFSLSIDQPAERNFPFSIECDRDFSPLALGKGEDCRDLAYLLEQIVAYSG